MAKKLKKDDLIDSIASECNVTKGEANKTINNFFEGLGKLLGTMSVGDVLQLVGKITVEVTHRDAYIAKNPRTKEDVHVEAKNGIKVKVGSELLEKVR